VAHALECYFDDAADKAVRTLWQRLALAGVPGPVVARARDVLKLHEKTGRAVTDELKPAGPVQVQLFAPVGHNIAERIRALRLDELRPIEALQLLSELQEELKRSCV